MKWILLLVTFAIVQYGEVKGYPQYNSAVKDLDIIVQTPFAEKPITNFESRSLASKSTLPILPYLSNAFDDTFAYISKKLELWEARYKQHIEHLKELMDGSKTNSKKDKTDPSPVVENTVSNNKTQENVILTTPTPDKSTNTQKPAPTKHDDEKNKPDEKDPLNTASNNKTQENVTQTIPVESTTNQKPVPTKNNKEEKPAEQEDKKDTFVPIKNDKDENAITPPITDNEEMVSIKPNGQVETSTKKNDETEESTSHENEKLKSSTY